MSKCAKIWLIVALSLVLTGCILFAGVMTAMGWDFTKLSTVKYETNQYEIREDFRNISLMTDTADVVFVPSEDGKTSIVCYEQKKVKHSVAVQDGTLTIQMIDERKWYDYIGIFFGSPKLTVYLPEAEYGALSLKSSTGDIHVENITVGKMALSVSTGKVTVTDVVCQGDVTIHVSTGKASLTNVACKNMKSDGDTGHMTLKNVIASEKISLERSTGSIQFDGSDGAEIFVSTSTGSITGSLLSDKVFFAQTDTGRVDVPQSTTGGKCQLTTDTGNIQITVNP